MTYTEEQVIDMAVTLGIPKDKALIFYHHYNAQGWKRGNGQEITNIKSQLWNWQKNGWRFGEKKKAKLYPIKGRFCKCGMPAVHKDSSGSYDQYTCENCMPEKVKERYG